MSSFFSLSLAPHKKQGRGSRVMTAPSLQTCTLTTEVRELVSDGKRQDQPPCSLHSCHYTGLLSSGLWAMTTTVKLTSVPTTAWPTAFSLEAPARPPRTQNPNLRAAGHPGSILRTYGAPPLKCHLMAKDTQPPGASKQWQNVVISDQSQNPTF